MSNAFDKASLVMLPHAYEEGKLYSLKPTDRSGDFTFSRGTDTATRVNEQGYIEKETVNLIKHSNNFSDVVWNKPSVTFSSGELGYDGTNDAWQFIKGSGGSKGPGQNISLNGVYTISVYVKINPSSGIGLVFGSTSQCVLFNISDANQTIAGYSTGIISYTQEYVGNDFYRLSATASSTASEVLIYMASPDGTGFNSTGATHIIQDFQLNYGLVAQPYLETTTAPVYGGLTDNMPRLDYTDASCPSLLLEPERTNIWYHSEYYSSLSNSNGPIFNYIEGISPEGVQNAVRVSASSLGARIQPNLTVNGSQLVWSLYVKHEGEDYNMRLNNYLGGTITYGAEVTVTSTAVTFNSYASGYDDADYEVIGDGWFRFWIVITPQAGGQLFQFRVLEGGSVATSYLAYGMQVEYGSYPTSYIPTYGSTQTRAADNLAQLDVTNLTSTYNTLYAEFEVSNITNQGKIALSDNSQDNRMTIYQNGSDLMLLLKAGGSSETSITSSSILSVGTNYKVVAKNQNGSHALFINGTKIGEENSTTPTGLIKLRFGNESDSIQTQKLLGEVKQTLLFQTALSDDECKALTAL